MKTAFVRAGRFLISDPDKVVKLEVVLPSNLATITGIRVVSTDFPSTPEVCGYVKITANNGRERLLNEPHIAQPINNLKKSKGRFVSYVKVHSKLLENTIFRAVYVPERENYHGSYYVSIYVKGEKK